MTSSKDQNIATNSKVNFLQSDAADRSDSNQDWSSEKAEQFYNLPQWSEGYFGLDESGHLTVNPRKTQLQTNFKLSEICAQLKQRGMQMPILLRFVDILQDRVKSLCEAFNQAIKDLNYQGQYTVCYPIKVNQQKRVVEGIVDSNQNSERSQVGLEAGSKPELMAVLAMSEKTNSVIVCNGYKDREYVRAALIATQLGHTVFLVVEKLSELNLILQESDSMGVEPKIGVRARLASKGESKWQDSGGDHSKFGLSASQIIRVVETLQASNRLSTFQLLHFHLGSQITSIRDIQNALKECARFYAELINLKVPISTVDVGGGLGVDYEGTQSQNHCSVNYTLSEYANNVVGAFFDIAEKKGISHPAIITESGRALTAHHAVLITNVIDSERPREVQVEKPSTQYAHELHELWRIFQEAKQTNENNILVECFHNSEYLLKQILEMFNHGVISLVERALAERIYRRVLFLVKSQLQPELQTHQELLELLNEKLASKFFVNFSIFQSLPDAWAIEQIFPLMPLAGLDVPPTETAVIQDITCDSDGMLKQYVSQQSVTKTIELPEYQAGQEYWLGLFMVGAYQEILGDMHNLFGDTHTVDFKLDESNQLQIVATEEGDSVEELLDYVDFNATWLLDSYKRQLKNTTLPQATQRQYLAELRQGIYGYCYLED
ncbi:biosynthetic arginine decarboxylase [Aliikangiella marina]|uniref:Arginine decarboxylase n=2 Tax=Aliikangiella marina TaxID=1712262 RepID=A0A545T7K4_9GAMM|nr:biosynthetic arginine decarboxylase [Aliikangiella marina]